MTDLSLKKSGRRRDDHYDVTDGAVVGRIMLFTANPTVTRVFLDCQA
jgi:hypothetical protein